MSSQSYTELYALADAGETSALLVHIAELKRNFPENKDALDWALIAAAEANQLETVRTLLDEGANIEGAAVRSYIHPLWKAAKRGHLEMVKLLVSRGANITATDNRGMTALDYAGRYSHAEVVRYLESLQ